MELIQAAWEVRDINIGAGFLVYSTIAIVVLGLVEKLMQCRDNRQFDQRVARRVRGTRAARGASIARARKLAGHK